MAAMSFAAVMARPPIAQAAVPQLSDTNSSQLAASGCGGNHQLNDIIQACTKIINLPDAPSTDRAMAYTIRGLAYAQANNIALARDDLKHAEDIKPSSSLDVMIGMIDINTSNSEEAITYLTKVVDAGAANALIFRYRGEAYENNAQYDEAIKDFNTALQLDPKLFGAINDRGAAYAKQGNLDAALADFKSILAVTGGSDPVVLLNICGVDLKKGNIEEGTHYCDQANKAAETNFFVQGGLGGTYYNAGQYKKALEYLDKAIALNPRDARSLYLRGVVQAKLGNPDAASKDKNAAALIEPDIAEFEAKNGVKE